MGDYSKTVFGRSRLPSRAIICAGVYTYSRSRAFRTVFDDWKRVQGSWVKYSFASVGGKRFLVIFGVYGAAMMLEILQCLRDGNVTPSSWSAQWVPEAYL